MGFAAFDFLFLATNCQTPDYITHALYNKDYYILFDKSLLY